MVISLDYIVGVGDRYFHDVERLRRDDEISALIRQLGEDVRTYLAARAESDCPRNQFFGHEVVRLTNYVWENLEAQKQWIERALDGFIAAEKGLKTHFVETDTLPDIPLLRSVLDTRSKESVNYSSLHELLFDKGPLHKDARALLLTRLLDREDAIKTGNHFDKEERFESVAYYILHLYYDILTESQKQAVRDWVQGYIFRKLF